MTVGFDLDGVLDRPAIKDLLQSMLNAGVQVHIITGIFDEAGDWQSEAAKLAKLDRLGIPWRKADPVPSHTHEWPTVHFLHAVDKSFALDYRLKDLGLRKGDLCQRLGIDIMIDDSETYCSVMHAMNGNLTIFHVR